MTDPFEFTVDYFSNCIPAWTHILGEEVRGARKILEIGSLEGRSATWLIAHGFAKEADGALHCIDTWGRNAEYVRPEISEFEARFNRNVARAKELHPHVAVVKHVGFSHVHMTRLAAEGHAGTFDFIYVDGSHRAHAVLGDLVLAFMLCRVGGVIACDDYLWEQGHALADRPKLAIDAFTNCYAMKIRILGGHRFYQVYVKKIAD